MKIEKTKNIVCDFLGCSNLASYKFFNEQNPNNSLNLCKNCMLKLHKLISSEVKNGEKYGR